jgi:hypothetical protein
MCTLWHRDCTQIPDLIFLSIGGRQINYVLAVSVLFPLLFGVVATAAAGGTFIEIGGITQSAPGGSDQNRRIDKPQTDKPQTGLGNLSVPGTTRRDNSLGGGGLPVSTGGHSLVPDQKTAIDKPQTGGGGTTLPFSNGGTFPTGPTTTGQPPNQFCSNADVTIGESHQSKLHCSNTVGGTVKQ